MDEIIKQLIVKVPNLVITFGIIFLVIYLLREYRRVREEIEGLVERRVNEKLGEVTSIVEAKISQVNILISELGEKHSELDSKFDVFNKDKTEPFPYKDTLKVSGDTSHLTENLEEYSARDLLELAQAQNDPQARAKLCNRILNHQDATAEELEYAGDMMRQANRYTLALQLYEKAHQKDPESISPHIELLCLIAELDYEKREEAINKAKDLILANPNITGFARIANALINLDRYQDLSDFSDKFIDILQGKNPKLKALALRNKAVALEKLGDISKSMEAFQKAFEISPEDDNIFKPYLALLKDQGKDKERMELIKKLIEIDPTDVNYYQFYIDALLKDKKYSEAIEWIEKAEQLRVTEMNKAILGRYREKAEAANNELQRTR